MKKVLIIAFIFIVLIILDGFFINPNGFKTNEIVININNLPEDFEGFKIMQISDLLINDTSDINRVKDIVKSINERKPDIIVFTGDLINEKNKLTDKDIDNLKSILKDATCTLYKYAVFGDNDLKNDELYNNIMIDADFKILNNESIYLFYKNINPIKITGLKNTNDLEKSFATVDEYDDIFNLVLTHYPDYIDNLNEYNNLIVLAGHSLKGQIRIPFFGGLIRLDGANKYYDSFYEVNGNRLYVSGGIGNNKVDFRLFNKPEINLYRLEKK